MQGRDFCVCKGIVAEEPVSGNPLHGGQLLAVCVLRDSNLMLSS